MCHEVAATRIYRGDEVQLGCLTRGAIAHQLPQVLELVCVCVCVCAQRAEL